MVYVEGCNDWTQIAPFEVDLDVGNDKSCLVLIVWTLHVILILKFPISKALYGFHIGMYSNLLISIVSVA